MEAKISIKFKKINGVIVNADLLKKTPLLLDTTRHTVKLLCNKIEEYFSDNKIKTRATFELTDGK